MAAQILVIENDVHLLHTLCQTLLDNGYDVVIAHEDQAALEFCAHNSPDLIILNLQLFSGRMSGFSLCREIRKNRSCPLLVLSARATAEEKIQALDGGADDCLELPLHPGEFLAHVRSALRRWSEYTPTPTCGVIACGELSLDVPAREVTLRGAPVRLTRTEFELLKYLVEHRGRVVTHAELAQVVSKTPGVEREYLRVYISQLRHKLEAAPLSPRLILTAAGVGYRFGR